MSEVPFAVARDLHSRRRPNATQRGRFAHITVLRGALQRRCGVRIIGARLGGNQHHATHGSVFRAYSLTRSSTPRRESRPSLRRIRGTSKAPTASALRDIVAGRRHHVDEEIAK